MRFGRLDYAEADLLGVLCAVLSAWLSSNIRIDAHAEVTPKAKKPSEAFLPEAEDAITSAIYEGAHSTRAQAQQLIASGNKPRNKDEWMFMNNFRAMSWVQTHRNEPIAQELILELHRIVTLNTMEGDDANFSGQFRDDKVFIGSPEGIPHASIEQAIGETIASTTRNPRYIHPLKSMSG